MGKPEISVVQILFDPVSIFSIWMSIKRAKFYHPSQVETVQQLSSLTHPVKPDLYTHIPKPNQK